MAASQVPSTLISTVPAQLDADLDGLVWPALLQAVAALADPMQSETVKGWLRGELGTPT